MRRVLFGGVELLGTEAGDADHADIAVAPGLLRNPFDQVVAVPLAAAAAVRFEDPARRTDDMHIAARNEELGVARLQQAGPERRPGRLRRQRCRDVRPLQVLVVDREREQHRKLLRRVRPIDIDGEIDAVAHRHGDVLFRNHPVVSRRPDHRRPGCGRPQPAALPASLSVMSSLPVRPSRNDDLLGIELRAVQLQFLADVQEERQIFRPRLVVEGRESSASCSR